MNQSDKEQLCHRCFGLGQAVKRICRRRDGTIISVTYDLRIECRACHGTGLACMEAEQ